MRIRNESYKHIQINIYKHQKLPVSLGGFSERHKTRRCRFVKDFQFGDAESKSQGRIDRFYAEQSGCFGAETGRAEVYRDEAVFKGGAQFVRGEIAFRTYENRDFGDITPRRQTVVNRVFFVCRRFAEPEFTENSVKMFPESLPHGPAGMVRILEAAGNQPERLLHGGLASHPG